MPVRRVGIRASTATQRAIKPRRSSPTAAGAARRAPRSSRPGTARGRYARRRLSLLSAAQLSIVTLEFVCQRERGREPVLAKARGAARAEGHHVATAERRTISFVPQATMQMAGNLWQPYDFLASTSNGCGTRRCVVALRAGGPRRTRRLEGVASRPTTWTRAKHGRCAGERRPGGATSRRGRRSTTCTSRTRDAAASRRKGADAHRQGARDHRACRLRTPLDGRSATSTLIGARRREAAPGHAAVRRARRPRKAAAARGRRALGARATPATAPLQSQRGVRAHAARVLARRRRRATLRDHVPRRYRRRVTRWQRRGVRRRLHAGDVPPDHGPARRGTAASVEEAAAPTRLLAGATRGARRRLRPRRPASRRRPKETICRARARSSGGYRACEATTRTASLRVDAYDVRTKPPPSAAARRGGDGFAARARGSHPRRPRAARLGGPRARCATAALPERSARRARPPESAAVAPGRGASAASRPATTPRARDRGAARARRPGAGSRADGVFAARLCGVDVRLGGVGASPDGGRRGRRRRGRGRRSHSRTSRCSLRAGPELARLLASATTRVDNIHLR